MKVLMWHLKEYYIKVVSMANRPEGIEPEELGEEEQKVGDCILAFVTVEKGDDLEKCSFELAQEVLKFAEDVKRENVVLCPFAHLSNNLAHFKEGLDFFKIAEDKLKNRGLKVFRSHFGSDKELLMDVYGHKGAVRFREL